jgi:hypothetical protein
MAGDNKAVTHSNLFGIGRKFEYANKKYSD